MAVAFQREIGKEGAQRLFLRRSDIVVAFQRLQVGDVGKELPGIHQVLVYVVEIGQQHLAPGVELVQRVGFSHMAGIHGMQAANTLHGRGQLVGRGVSKELGNGGVAGCPHGCGALAGQSLIQEEAGALAGEHHGETAQVGAVLGQQVAGYQG